MGASGGLPDYRRDLLRDDAPHHEADMSEVHIFLCGPRIYEYDGWTFEYGMTTCWPLKKDGDPMKRAGRKFYAMIHKFFALTDKEQATYRVGGGCQEFRG